MKEASTSPNRAAQTSKSSWFHDLRTRSHDTPHVFAFPYAGGSSSALRQLDRVISPVYGLHIASLPGRGSRFTEQPESNLSTIVKRLTDAVQATPARKFVLYGHSMGGLLAFEITRELRRRRGAMPQALVLSGARPPHRFAKTGDDATWNLPHDRFIERIRELEGTPKEVLEHPELLKMILPMLRADFRICETYDFHPEAPLDIPLIVLSGNKDTRVRGKDVQEWRLHTQASCRFMEFEGGHFFLNHHWRDIGIIINSTIE
ncbi:MAG: thioesterase II family protein [Lautropia mirabilis]|jgi:thioesterase